jgi:myo-inositol 2-dehydrogenase / D-chiro-inositol 1-dehydrogenase
VAELRAGIVGAGWIAGTHAATLADLDGVRVVASADVLPGRADYEDWRAMLAAERLDAVVVCTPPDAHRDVAVAAAEAGLAIYLEKPVAHAMDDARAIAAAVAEAGVVCAVGYQYRGLTFLADLPGDARLLVGTGISDTLERAWLGDRTRGGGIMLERASHLIDLERALAGNVAGVTALEEGDAVAAALRFSSGALGSVVVGRAAGGPGWRLELAGDEGTVVVELDPHFRAHGAGVELWHDGPPPLRLSMACFVDAAARRDPSGVCCDLEDGIATLAVALAAQDAAQRGATAGLDARNA